MEKSTTQFFDTTHNKILAGLAEEEIYLLKKHSVTVNVGTREFFYKTGDHCDFVYFPLDCYFSLVRPVDNESQLEVGMVGREGVLGITACFGGGLAPFDALAQGSGRAIRVPLEIVPKVMARCPELARRLGCYLHIGMTQVARSAGCAHFHRIDQRLARWLLLTHDRALSDSFPVTHQLLSDLLGVRRAGISAAASDLQKQELIYYRRGEITINDRMGLEAMSCPCYMDEVKLYREVMKGVLVSKFNFTGL